LKTEKIYLFNFFATFKEKTYDLFALFLPKSVSEDKNPKRAQNWKNRTLIQKKNKLFPWKRTRSIRTLN